MNLQEKYKKEVVKQMMAKFSYGNVNAVPKIEKVVINSGIGRLMNNTANAEEKLLPHLMDEVALISSQRPVATKARKSIAGFKIRQGQVIGLKVTLRGRRMYDFLTRLINVALPRVRDFRGVSVKSLDDHGNLTIGVKEHTVFPEVAVENTRSVFGLEITVCTTAKTKEEASALLTMLGFPLK